VTGLWSASGGASANCIADITFGNGNSTSSFAYAEYAPNVSYGFAQAVGYVYATSTANELLYGNAYSSVAGGTVHTVNIATTSVASQTYIAFRARSGNGSQICIFNGGTVELVGM